MSGMWDAAPTRRLLCVAACLALAVSLAPSTSSARVSAAVGTSPLPGDLWALDLTGQVRSLTAPGVLFRVHSAGVNVLVIRRNRTTKGAFARVEAAAKRWGFTLVTPLPDGSRQHPGSASDIAAMCPTVPVNGGPDVVGARSLASAKELQGVEGVDMIVLTFGRVRDVARLASLSSGAQLLAIPRLKAGFSKRAWRAAIKTSATTGAFRLGVAPRGSRAVVTLSKYLALLASTRVAVMKSGVDAQANTTTAPTASTSTSSLSTASSDKRKKPGHPPPPPAPP